MNVANTVLVMMKAYPGLFSTRVMALKNLFGKDGNTRWVNGELICGEQYPDCGGSDEDVASAQKAFDDAAAEMRPYVASDLIRSMRHRDEEQFTYDNAHLLCIEASSRLGPYVNFEGRRFDDMPEDVKPDWLAAAKELAHAIVRAGEAGPPTSSASAEQRERATSEAKAQAKQFLDRFKSSDLKWLERRQRETALLREARALGLKLVRENGDAVATE